MHKDNVMLCKPNHNKNELPYANGASSMIQSRQKPCISIVVNTNEAIEGMTEQIFNGLEKCIYANISVMYIRIENVHIL